MRENRELEFLKPAFTKGGVFLDLGANSGYYSLMCLLFGADYVFAVEANPKMCGRLAFNSEANGFSRQLKVCQTAVGARDGLAELLLLGGDQGSNRIAQGKENGERISVPMHSLLSLVEENRIEKMDAMKIDIEGMEDLVLLPFFKVAPVRFWPRLVVLEYVQRADWKSDILDYMKDIGYSMMGQSRSNVFLIGSFT